MPSSTSNSDINRSQDHSEQEAIEYRQVPQQSWSVILVAASTILVVFMIGWELLARQMYHTPGSYQSSYDTMWAEERRKLDMDTHPKNNMDTHSKNNKDTHPIRLVLAGSSRMLWNADLNILEAGLHTRPLQLALPGTGPALIVEDIVENTEFDGLLLVGVTPFLFNRLDEGFFGGVALDTYKYQSPSNWIGSKLHDFLSDYFGFLDDAFALNQLLNRYTDLPIRPGAENLMSGDWKLGNVYADRQTDMWEPVEVEGSFDNTQMTNFWRGPGHLEGDPMPLEKLEEMQKSSIEFFAPLVKKLQARGGDVIFILMPSSGLYMQFAEKNNYHENVWKPMIEAFDVAGINTMEIPELSSELDIPEWSHLSRTSQDIFSERIIAHIENAYHQHTQRSIYSVMDLPEPKD